jgi:hypothetical protein
MKKIFLILFILLLCFSNKSFTQNNENGLSFCKQFFLSEGLLKLSLKHTNDDEFNVLLSEANTAARRSLTLLADVKPNPMNKLMQKDIDTLKSMVNKFITVIERITDNYPDQMSVMKTTLWIELSDQILIRSKIFPKLMK